MVFILYASLIVKIHCHGDFDPLTNDLKMVELQLLKVVNNTAKFSASIPLTYCLARKSTFTSKLYL